jgi:hypothetical protein
VVLELLRNWDARAGTRAEFADIAPHGDRAAYRCTSDVKKNLEYGE